MAPLEKFHERFTNGAGSQARSGRAEQGQYHGVVVEEHSERDDA